MPRLPCLRLVCYAPGMAEGNETAAATQHPLAVTRTELVWEGKYDSAGNRVAPLRVALPFQTVETVNESAADRRHTLELFGQHRPTEWRNRLIWGDKKYVLPSLLAEFAGKVSLIYIDPPFDTGADFSFTASVPNQPDHEEDDAATFTKEPSVIEHKAYRDTWGRGLNSYLQWFYETAVLLHELLHENGSLYVHLDWHVSHYAKTILDEVFGNAAFEAEIIWQRTSSHNDSTHWATVHDVIFFYTKTDDAIWNDIYTDYTDEYLDSFYRYKDERGVYRLDHIIRSRTMGPRPNLSYEYKKFKPKWGWRVTREKLEKLDSENRLSWSSTWPTVSEKI